MLGAGVPGEQIEKALLFEMSRGIEVGCFRSWSVGGAILLTWYSHSSSSICRLANTR